MGIITFKHRSFWFFLAAFFAVIGYSSAQCPTIADTTQSFCDIQSPTVANLQATSNGNGVVWYATATSTTPLSSSAGLVNNTTYFADDNSGTCGPRPSVTVTIYRRPDGQAFQGPCVEDASQATLADFVVIGNNIQWYDQPNGGNLLPLTTQLVEGTIYYASQTNPDTGCETSRLAVLATVGVVPVPTGPPVQQFCITPGNPAPTVANLQASGNNNWYLTPSAAVPLNNNTILIDGQNYYATTVDPPCESDSRLEVLVDLVQPSNAGTNGTFQICQNQVATTPPINLFGLLGGSPENSGTWTGPLPTSNGFQGTVNISSLTVAGSPYVFTYTINANICGPSSATVTITVLPMPTAAITGNATICANTSTPVTFTGTPNATVTYNINGGANQTITINGSGTATLNNTFTSTSVFNLVSVASSGTPSCVQPLTGSITVTVVPLPTVSIASNSTICSGQSATVTFTGTPNATVTYTVNAGGNQTIVLNGSGTASITNTYTATTTFALVSVASSGSPSCSRPITGNVTITVIPLPTVAVSSNATVCPNGSATITFTGTPNAIVTYNVNGGANQTITLNGSGTASITSNFAATTVYNLVSVATAGTPSCSRPIIGSITITVLPPPTVSIASNQTICSGQSATVTFTGTPNATVTYNINGGANQTVVLNASGTAVITNTYTANATFNLVSVSSAGTPSCMQPITGSVTITVIPLPTVSISANATICPNGSATVTFTGTPNSTVTFNVNGGANQTIVLNASGSAAITNTYAATTTFNLVSVASAGVPSCSRPITGTVTITVVPLPTVSIASSATICSGQSRTITFTGTPNAIVTYNINGGANQIITLNASGTATITNTYTATTTINLVSVATSGTPSCSQPVTGSVTITVVPLPTVTISANATICSGQSATVTFTGTPNAIVTYNINGSANQTITLNASGTATITNTYTANAVFNLVSVATTGTPSCSQPQTGTVTIQVLPPPTVAITLSATPICSGANATVTFTGTPNAIVTYHVNGGANQTITLNASGTATITGSYTANTTFTLISVATGGTPSCSVPATGSVTITVLPLPTVTIASNQTICSGQSATVTFTGTPNATVTYNINGGANQTIVLNAGGTAVITNTYIANATFNLVSVSSAGPPICTQPVTGSVTITVVPLPTASIAANATICPNQSATVTFTGTPNSTVTYNINGGSNQTIVLNAAGTATITNTYTVTTVFNLVSVTSSGTPGCVRPLTGNITITVLPIPTVSIASSASICSGQNHTVTFTGTPNAIVTYNINGGSNQTITLNASGTASISNTYTATTTINLVSVATSGTPSCSQPVTGSVTITVVPLPTVTISANATICSGQSATVTFTGTPNAIVTYNINGSANQTITLNASGTATITNTYTANAVFNLVSVATTGTPSCSQPQTGTVTIQVLPPPTVAITLSATPICSGANATVTFTGTPNAIVTYHVNGGANQTITLNASGTATITGSYTANTTFTLISVATGGTPSCSVPATGSVTITVLPLPTVTIASNQTICSGQSATVTFTGTPNATVTYNINGGANQTIVLNASGTAIVTNTYTANATFNLLSIASDGTPSCTQLVSGTVTIDIQQPPVVAISGSATICSGSNGTIIFTGTPNATVTYNINGGPNQTIVLDGAGNATITNTFTSTSVFNLVSATTQGTPGCTAPQNGSATITVVPSPTVSISGSTTICTGGNATITFTGTPNADVIFAVVGGPDLVVTLDASGTATFTQSYSSTSTIQLISVSTTGTPPCVQPVTGSVNITVVPQPTATIAASSTSLCSGTAATITFTGTPNSIVTYNVNGGINQVINLDATGTATIAPILNGTSTYNLIAISTSAAPICTQTLSGSVTVTVTTAPNAGVDVSNFAICSNVQPVDLFTLLGANAQSGGIWSPSLASGSGIFNPAVDAAGTYTYSIAAVGPCPGDSAEITVSIVAAPNAGTDATLNICSNANPQDLFLLLGNAQPGGQWSPSLASGTGIFDPAVDVAGTYTYTVGGIAICANDTATVTVTVTPGPDAGQNGALTLCTDSASQNLFDFLGGTPQVGGTWSPALASGTGIFNPAVDAPGVYTYTFFGNQPCDNDTATVTVSVNPIPNAGTDGTAFFCSNYPAADLFTSLGGTPQTGGTWSPALASGTGVFNPLVDAPGVYTYSVGGNFCSLDTATVTVSVVQSPNAGGPGATINTCFTTTSIDLTIGLNGSQGAGTWNDDNSTGALSGSIFNPNAAGVGTYNFTYTVGGGVSPCLFDTATVTIIVDPVPNAGTFSGIQSICSSAGTFDLQTLLTGEIEGGVWTDINNVIVPAALDVSVLTAGNYTFTYTLTNSCGTDAEQVQFTILPIPTLAIPNITLMTPICVGSPAMVNISGISDGTYTLNYNLTGSNVAAAQSASVTITAGAGSFAIPASQLANIGTTTITFEGIVNQTTLCSSQLVNVLVNIVINPASDLDPVNLSIANACQNSDVTVVISNATNLPNGNYQFNYSIPGASPPTGTSAVVAIIGGNGQFTVPGSSFATAGNYTLTISGIVSLSSGCSNLNENASASFQILPAPVITGATLQALPVCLGLSNTVTISGATAITDGNYTINYQLSGAATGSYNASVTFSAGAATFTIPAADLPALGNVTVSIDQIVGATGQCGASGTSILPVTFEVVTVATPTINPQGNEFCSELNPTVASLTGNIPGLQTVIWYDAPTGGNLIPETQLLVDGQTYYAAYTVVTCESSIRLEVTVEIETCEEEDIVIPDGFSPNEDGINDSFVIVNLPERYPRFKLEIYNRYGNILYKGNINTPNWDGRTTEGGMKMGSEVVPTGVYFYILEFNDGSRKPVQGRVYLSR